MSLEDLLGKTPPAIIPGENEINPMEVSASDRGFRPLSRSVKTEAAKGFDNLRAAMRTGADWLLKLEDQADGEYTVYGDIKGEIRRLANTIGGMPERNVPEFMLTDLRKSAPEARKILEDIIASDPSLGLAYFEYVTGRIPDKFHEEALVASYEALSALEDGRSLTFNELMNVGMIAPGLTGRVWNGLTPRQRKIVKAAAGGAVYAVAVGCGMVPPTPESPVVTPVAGEVQPAGEQGLVEPTPPPAEENQVSGGEVAEPAVTETPMAEASPTAVPENGPGQVNGEAFPQEITAEMLRLPNAQGGGSVSLAEAQAALVLDDQDFVSQLIINRFESMQRHGMDISTIRFIQMVWVEGDTYRWEAVPVDSQGNLTHWLQYQDEAGVWHYAEQLGYDSRITENTPVRWKSMPEGDWRVALDSKTKFFTLPVQVNTEGAVISWINTQTGEFHTTINLGEARVNEFGQAEVWSGEQWIAAPDQEFFDTQYIHIAENNQIRYERDGNVWVLDQGVWISEAELETKKVLSYLAENTERANLVPMQRIEFRVSDELQREIWEKVPEEIRLPIEEDLAEGETPKPLYFMIPDEAALQSVLNTLSINVGSTSEPVPVTLSDHKFVITFLNAYEDIHGVDFRYFVGHDKFLYKIGTFLDESSGVVHMVINASPIASTVFTYNDLRAGQLIFEGVIGGFTKVASGIPRDSNYTRDLFTINTIYDNNHPFDEMRDRTWMMWPCIVDPIGNLPWYLNGQYYLDYRNQIPGMFHSFIPGLD